MIHPWLSHIGVCFPLLQAPMAGVSTPELAAAVSNAGGLGALGVGNLDAQRARAAIQEFRSLSAGPLHVNVFCHAPPRRDADREARWLQRLQPHFAAAGATAPTELGEIYRSFLEDDDMLEMLCAVRPNVVSFHFGLPAPERVLALRAAGIVLLASATNLAEARAVEAAGLDAIIAQGYEAGGHRGVFDPDAHDDQLGTLALTRVLVRASPLPVISAGGIMDGAGIAAVERLGACAAQLGTAFVACPESQADAGYRRALASDAAHHTTMTRAISGRPARALANRFTTLDDAAAPAYPVAYDAAKKLHSAHKHKKEFGYGAQWAGQGAPLSRARPVAELVEILRGEWETAH